MVKLVLILFAAFLLPTESLKVVSILPFGSNSHFVIGQSITKSLLKAGHEVTVLSPYPLKKPLANYHDIDLSPLLEKFKKGLKFFLVFSVVPCCVSILELILCLKGQDFFLQVLASKLIFEPNLQRPFRTPSSSPT